jgi:hypothetical protein
MSLQRTINAKLTIKGKIARLNELFRDLFQCSDAEKTSLKERRAMSPIVTAAPYWGSPGLVAMEIALEEIALDEIMLKSIIMPPKTISLVNLLLSL